MLSKTAVNFCKCFSMRNARSICIGSHSYVHAQVVDNNIDSIRSRLIYQSRKRGILENCIIFTTFADKHLKTFDNAQLQKYDALINSKFDEWDLYAWAIGSKPVPKEFDNDIMNLLKSHVKRQDHNIK